MRVLVMNVNTNERMTAGIRASAEAAAGPDTEIVATEPAWGPEAVEGHFEGYLSAVAIYDRLSGMPDKFDALVWAGFGEPGREGAQELLDVPVVDITEAAAHMACLIGHSYSVVTTLDRAVPQIGDRLLLAGLRQRCASIRATGLGVLELERDPDATLTAMVAQARRAVEEDGAEVICLGCAGMTGLDEALAAATGVPVIDGVAAAVKLAEALHGLGLRTSKSRSFGTPRPKSLTGWPLSRQGR